MIFSAKDNINFIFRYPFQGVARMTAGLDLRLQQLRYLRCLGYNLILKKTKPHFLNWYSEIARLHGIILPGFEMEKESNRIRDNKLAV